MKFSTGEILGARNAFTHAKFVSQGEICVLEKSHFQLFSQYFFHLTCFSFSFHFRFNQKGTLIKLGILAASGMEFKKSSRVLVDRKSMAGGPTI